MAINLPPPTGDAKNPPNEPVGWGKLFNWFYLLWQWVTTTLPNRLTYGGDTGSYSSAIFASAGQADTGVAMLLGPSIVLAANNTNGQSTTTGVQADWINWTKDIDTTGSFNTSTGTYTVTSNGIYFIHVQGILNSVAFATLSSFIVRIWKNTSSGTLLSSGGEWVKATGNNFCHGEALWVGRLNTGDTIVTTILQSSGSTVIMYNGSDSNSYNRLSIVRLGP